MACDFVSNPGHFPRTGKYVSQIGLAEKMVLQESSMTNTNWQCKRPLIIIYKEKQKCPQDYLDWKLVAKKLWKLQFMPYFRHGSQRLTFKCKGKLSILHYPKAWTNSRRNTYHTCYILRCVSKSMWNYVCTFILIFYTATVIYKSRKSLVMILLKRQKFRLPLKIFKCRHKNA